MRQSLCASEQLQCTARIVARWCGVVTTWGLLVACASLPRDKTPQEPAETKSASPASSQAPASLANTADATQATPTSVRICLAMETGVPCNPLASIYSDAALTSLTTSAEVSAADGAFVFYAKPGMYTVQVSSLGSYQNISAAVPPTGASVAPESRVAVQRNSDGSLAVSLSGGIVARESLAQPSPGGTTDSSVQPSPPIIVRTPPKLSPAAPDPTPSSANPPALEPSAGQPIQYVDYTGNDNNDGLSWGTAKASVMAAYDALPAYGGTIYIMAGPGGDASASFIPSTGTPGQGIWIMGATDPNYASPPPGWRRVKPNVNFIGVAGTSHQANAHDGGQVGILAGTSRNQPCIWLSGVGGPLLFQNLKCQYPGRAVVVGETSNNLRNGSGAVAGVTFDNVAGAVQGVPGNGPSVDITGGSFWLYFNDCVFGGNYQAPSVLDNQHAAMLIDGTGNAGNGLIFITNLNTGGGGIKFIPGANGGSLTVNGMTEEGDGGNGPDIPPAIYVTYTDNFTTFDFENIAIADPGPSGAEAVFIGGNGPPGAVVASGNLSGSGNVPSAVVGPATVMGEYPNEVANAPETPAQMGQVGFFNGYVVGQTDAARWNFSPVAIRFPNIASQVPTQWQPQPGISVTPGVTAPDGTANAGRAVDGSQQIENLMFFNQNITVAVGDYFIGGVWIQSLASDGKFASSATTDINLGGAFSSSGSLNGAVSSAVGLWSWQWFIYKVTAVSDIPTFVEFAASVGPESPIEAYAPILMHIPSGAVSDAEAYEIATNLTSYPDGLPSGTVATLRGQQFAFGGTGNFFGILTQSNTANRNYVFPDASGTVALTDIAQNWTATQTLDSPVLTDPTIDGQPLDSPPIATFSAFLPGALSTAYAANTFTPDYPIVVTRLEVTLKTSSQGCTSSAIISVQQGSNDLDLPIPLGTTDSGPVNVQMAAGTPIQVLLSTPAQGCSIQPQDANVVVHYRMQ